MFFQSAFTHANCHHAPITQHPNGHKGLWIEQAASLQYDSPAQCLVPLQMNLKGFLALP